MIEELTYRSEAESRLYTHTAYLKDKQMKVLVEDLFEYTQVKYTTTQLNPVRLHMIAMLEQLAASFELEAHKKHMRNCDCGEPNPLMMEADTEKLGRVLHNLIVHALKYGTGGRHIFLDAQRIGSEVVVKVYNDGALIPHDALSQLFDRFYRVEESRSTETGGTGSGLAIATSNFALHGGYIYADSSPELTSFVILLPLKVGASLTDKTK